jgi:hypothetical protein
MTIIGKIVKHKKFGTGKITANMDGRITVLFEQNIEKKFVYPNAFEKFLVFVDSTQQKIVLEDLAKLEAERKDAIRELKNIKMKEKEKATKTKKKTGVKQKITVEMAKISFDYAKKVYDKQISMDDAKHNIEQEAGMNPISAQDYMNDFAAMMDGNLYKVAMKNSDTKLFIESIYLDFGSDRFKKAMDATWQHVEYFEDISGKPLKGKRNILVALAKKYNYVK